MRNIMDEYIIFMKKSLLNYCKIVYDRLFDKRIAQAFIDVYIDVRYSDYIDSESVKLNVTRKIVKSLDNVKNELIAEASDSDAKLIQSYRKFASHFYDLDQLYLLEAQKKVIEDISLERNQILGIDDKKFINEFSTILRTDIKKKKDFLDGFDSQTFSLDFTKYNKHDYGVKLVNNIVFPEVYSDLAIKKAAEKDNINEDLTAIAFMQLTCTVINDLITCGFDKNYYLYLPASYFDKKTKIHRLFSIIDNPFIQDRLKIVVSYSCFVRYKSYVMEYIRNGFVFAMYLDEKFEYSSDNIKFLELFDRIFIEKNKYYYKDMKNNGKIRDRIISIDEVK